MSQKSTNNITFCKSVESKLIRAIIILISLYGMQLKGSTNHSYFDTKTLL